MGACCSKTTSTLPSTPTPPQLNFKPNPNKPVNTNHNPIVATVTHQETPKKEIFVVKHRKSLETDRNPDQLTRKSTDRKEKTSISISNPNSDISQLVAETVAGGGGLSGGKVMGATVRTSSCTKEEVEAILIQCGRLSRSSSGVKPAGGETPTRGRRYSGSKRSFDFDMEMGSKNDGDDEVAVVDGDHRRRQQREPRVSSPSRRRSRERDPQQRSGSKERGSGSGNGGRRVSRSPNRRSESPNPVSNCSSGVGVGAGGGGSNRPGKMVSVPATDKRNNAGGGEVVDAAAGVKRIQVKRNGGDAGSRAAASPRARSPMAIRVLNENQNQQPVTLSRSNSRKGEQSPYRRNPLGEIDTNAAGSDQLGNKKQNCEKTMNSKTSNVKNCIAKEPQMIDEIKPPHNQIVSRTRSSRLSRDLDINPEALLNPNPNPNPPSYASLLLEDIQNFHQKNPTTATVGVATPQAAPPPPAFTLPACVSKACSILEAVADLNSATSTNDRQFKKENLVEPSFEKMVNDDLMEPSLHKYVTVRRGVDVEAEEQESSGSNSFAGSQQLSWVSSSWEPNSGDSTNCWTSDSRSNGRETDVKGQMVEYPRNGIGRGRLGHGRNAYSLPNNATVGST